MRNKSCFQAVQQLQYLIDWLKVVQHFHLLMAICEIVALFYELLLNQRPSVTYSRSLLKTEKN